MSLQAVPGFCLVRMLSAPEQTAGGILLPDTVRKKAPRMWGHPDDKHCWHQRGEVISIGKPKLLVEKWKDPKTGADKSRERFSYADFEVGDIVIFSWVGEQVSGDVYRIKMADVEAIDHRTIEELANMN